MEKTLVAVLIWRKIYAVRHVLVGLWILTLWGLFSRLQEFRRGHSDDLHLTHHHAMAASSTSTRSTNKVGAASPATNLQKSSPKKRHHAIVVPYRNRQYHYQQFVEAMDAYLSKEFHSDLDEFSLWVIEQDDPQPFNRGWLANVGLAEVFKAQPQTECITFHDIDLVPDTNDLWPANEQQPVRGPVFYDKCEMPTQIGSELSHFNWTTPYNESAGGVLTMHAKHWRQINGFSNDYVGWGGEDDDLFQRLRLNGLLDPKTKYVARPPKGYGRFRTISQNEEHHGKRIIDMTYYQTSLKLLGQMQSSDNQTTTNGRWRYDGLSDLQYTVTTSSEQQRDKDDNSNNNQDAAGFAHKHHILARQQLLEFVHIPQTGAGAIIEQAAAKAGIPWGVCHFQSSMNEKDDCPEPPNFAHLGIAANGRGAGPIWHIPPRQWSINLMTSKQTFTVVRNPYDIAISIFYDDSIGFKGNGTEKDDPGSLNSFLQTFYSQPPPLYMLRQSDYVFNPKDTKQSINHVLKFENWREEFVALMDQYNLSSTVKLPFGQSFDNTAVAATSGSRQFQVKDLSNGTLALIEQHYDPDFAAFTYDRLEGFYERKILWRALKTSNTPTRQSKYRSTTRRAAPLRLGGRARRKQTAHHQKIIPKTIPNIFSVLAADELDSSTDVEELSNGLEELSKEVQKEL